MQTFFRLRNQKLIASSLTFLTFSIMLLSMAFLAHRVLSYPQPFKRFLVTSFYFTTQSNVIAFIVLLLFLLKFSEKKWFQRLAFVALIDMLVTGIVFHLFLIQHMPVVNFIQHLLHTWSPLAYVLFYYLILSHHLPLKQFAIGLLHPLIFMISVYTWIHPLFGGLLTSILFDFPSSTYVYPFLNPTFYERGIAGLLILNLGIFAPMIAIFSFFMLYIKVKIEAHLMIHQPT